MGLEWDNLLVGRIINGRLVSDRYIEPPFPTDFSDPGCDYEMRLSVKKFTNPRIKRLLSKAKKGDRIITVRAGDMLFTF